MNRLKHMRLVLLGCINHLSQHKAGAISALRHEPNQAAATKSRSTYYTLCLCDYCSLHYCIKAGAAGDCNGDCVFEWRLTLVAAASARRGTILQLEPLSTAINSRARVSSAQ
jgi:hypothetical protein